MHNCNSCGGCAGCSGCAGSLSLTAPEIAMLESLAQIPFLPVARRADDMTPVCLEEEACDRELCGKVLACLEKKGLIDLDYRTPLTGFDYAAYGPWPVHGSMALTQRGQSVVELLQTQGVTEE